MNIVIGVYTSAVIVIGICASAVDSGCAVTIAGTVCITVRSNCAGAVAGAVGVHQTFRVICTLIDQSSIIGSGATSSTGRTGVGCLCNC